MFNIIRKPAYKRRGPQNTCIPNQPSYVDYAPKRSAYLNKSNDSTGDRSMYSLELNLNTETLVWMYYAKMFDSIKSQFSVQLYFEVNYSYLQGHDLDQLRKAVRQAEQIGNQEYEMKFLAKGYEGQSFNYESYYILMKDINYINLIKQHQGLCVLVKEKFQKLIRDLMDLGYEEQPSAIPKGHYVIVWLPKSQSKFILGKLHSLLDSYKKLDQTLTPKMNPVQFTKYSPSTTIQVLPLDFICFYIEYSDIRYFEIENKVMFSFQEKGQCIELKIVSQTNQYCDKMRQKLLDFFYNKSLIHYPIESQKMSTDDFQKLYQILQKKSGLDEQMYIFQDKEIYSMTQIIDNKYNTNVSYVVQNLINKCQQSLFLLCSEKDKQYIDMIIKDSIESLRGNNNTNNKNNNINQYQDDSEIEVDFNFIQPQQNISNNIKQSSPKKVEQKFNMPKAIQQIVQTPAEQKLSHIADHMTISTDEGFIIKFYNEPKRQLYLQNKFDEQDFNQYLEQYFNEPFVITPLCQDDELIFKISSPYPCTRSQGRKIIVDFLDNYVNHAMNYITDYQRNLALDEFGQSNNCDIEIIPIRSDLRGQQPHNLNFPLSNEPNALIIKCTNFLHSNKNNLLIQLDQLVQISKAQFQGENEKSKSNEPTDSQNLIVELPESQIKYIESYKEIKINVLQESGKSIEKNWWVELLGPQNILKQMVLEILNNDGKIIQQLLNPIKEIEFIKKVGLMNIHKLTFKQQCFEYYLFLRSIKLNQILNNQVPHQAISAPNQFTIDISDMNIQAIDYGNAMNRPKYPLNNLNQLTYGRYIVGNTILNQKDIFQYIVEIKKQ